MQAARRELADNNAANKNLLNDAHWMPRKILPPPTNVVVLPDGVYKPPPEKQPDRPAPPHAREPAAAGEAAAAQRAPEQQPRAAEAPAPASLPPAQAGAVAAGQQPPSQPPVRILFPDRKSVV